MPHRVTLVAPEALNPEKPPSPRNFDHLRGDEQGRNVADPLGVHHHLQRASSPPPEETSVKQIEEDAGERVLEMPPEGLKPALNTDESHSEPMAESPPALSDGVDSEPATKPHFKLAPIITDMSPLPINPLQVHPPSTSTTPTTPIHPKAPRYTITDVVAATAKRHSASSQPSAGFPHTAGPEGGDNSPTVASSGMQGKFKDRAMKIRLKQQEEKKKRLVAFIHPKQPMKVRWDIFVGALIVYSVLVTPLRIGFDVDAVGAMMYFDFSVDALFGIDLLFCFFTGYYEDDHLIKSLPKIQSRYLRSWFLPDLLSTLPIDNIAQWVITAPGMNVIDNTHNELNVTASDQASASDAQFAQLGSLRLIKALRLARLLKLMRLLRLARKAQAVDTTFMSPALLMLTQMFGRVIFVAHMLACAWFSVYHCKTLIELKGDVVQEEGWLKCGNDNLFSQYLSSFYWIITTMMGIGYGDIAPVTLSERIFGMMTMMIGSVTFGLIIVSVSIIIETLNPELTYRKMKVDGIRAFLNDRSVSKALRDQVLAHFEYFYNEVSVFPEWLVMADFPHSLKQQLVYEGRKTIIEKFVFFKSLDAEFVLDVVVFLKPMQLQYRQSLGSFGALNSQAYFVLKGKIEATTPLKDGTMSIFALYTPGDDFELSCLVTENDDVMRGSYRALNVTDLLWLEKDDLSHVLAEYVSCAKVAQQYVKCQRQLALEAQQSATTVLPNLGMAFSMILYKNELRKLDHILDVFDADNMKKSSTIRTYRRFMADRDDTQRGNNLPEINKRGKNSKRGGGREGDGDGEGEGVGDDSPLHKKKKGKKIGFSGDAKIAPEEPIENSSIGRRVSRNASVAIRRILAQPEYYFEEVEETSDDLRERKIIDPTHPKKVSWDLFIGVLILWSVIIVPYRLGFDIEPTPGSAPAVFDIIQDLMFGLDILFCFRTAFQDEHLVYVTDPKSIASKYLKSWFAIDFFSTFPIDRILIAVAVADTISSNSTNTTDFDLEEDTGMERFLKGSIEIIDSNITVAPVVTSASTKARSLKMIKVLRLVRLTKLTRLLKLGKSTKKLDNYIQLSDSALKMMKLVLVLLFVGHLFGCFLNYVSDNLTPEGETAFWWSSSTVNLDYDSSSVEKYFACLYWAFTTMTTVGYGDIIPTNDTERLYVVLIQLCGATTFGYVVGSVNVLANSRSGAAAVIHETLSTTLFYMEGSLVTKAFVHKVNEQLVYSMHVQSPFEVESTLSNLPWEIRREVIIQSYRDIIPRIPLFKKQTRDFVAQLVLKLRPIFCVTGSLVYCKKQGPDGVYFLTGGLIQMRFQTLVQKVDKKELIYAGKFFGHEIYTGDASFDIAEATYSALTDCCLMLLLDGDVGGIMGISERRSGELSLALRQMMMAQPNVTTKGGKKLEAKLRKEMHKRPVIVYAGKGAMLSAIEDQNLNGAKRLKLKKNEENVDPLFVDMEHPKLKLPEWIDLGYKDQKPNHLFIVAVKARNVAIMDEPPLFSKELGSSDPYTTIQVGDDETTIVKSKTIFKNLSPTWNEFFSIKCSDPEKDIIVKLYDYDFLGGDDFIGQFSMKLGDLAAGEEWRQWKILSDEDGVENIALGEILIGFRWVYDKRALEPKK